MKVKGFTVCYRPEEQRFDTSGLDDFLAHKEIVSVRQEFVGSSRIL